MVSSSFRAQTNLQLQLAERSLSLLDSAAGGDDWGGNYPRAMAEIVMFRLALAYRCHIADLCSQKQLTLIADTARAALDAIAGAVQIPELDELSDRERHDDWLRRFLDYRFIEAPSQQGITPVAPDVLAQDRGSRIPESGELEESLRELHLLIARQRDSLQEY